MGFTIADTDLYSKVSFTNKQQAQREMLLCSSVQVNMIESLLLLSMHETANKGSNSFLGPRQ